MNSKRFFVKFGGLLMLACGFLYLPLNAQQKQAKEDTILPTIQMNMPELLVVPDDSLLDIYRGSAPKINDLVHTKLAVNFDYAKRFMYGKEWVTLKPHFYNTDSLKLDAKWMDIKKVELDQNGKLTPLKYTYDSLQLHIYLNKSYTRKEKYTLYIDYVSRPNLYEAAHHGGSAAIADDKGLYFINPDGTDPGKPIEIWTQGETESNSVWFPTIDKPDQKTTEEIDMTVPDKYVTLSNGLMVSSKKNSDGTRTDIWKMNLPNAPYLFMMAVGPFVKVKDHYKKLPVNYYLEKKYAPYAKDIFGDTPDMIAFYEKVLGVPFAWPKYSQIVVRDYVSGAMENTSATLLGEFLNETPRQLIDNNNEVDICHELFHQWFGDLVTTESWSNLTLNESFADFSEALWLSHRYGEDAGDEHNYEAMQDYFNYIQTTDEHNLVRFHYKSREDMFDPITYQKGGRILNMLRHYVGDSAFFHSLHEYLVKHQFGTGEAQQLRLAFEDVTGQDMNWFWNQWYYGKGYPDLDINYKYDDAAGKVAITIKQTQKNTQFFKLPMAVDIYAGGQKKRYNIMMTDSVQTFTFPYSQHPDLVNVDAQKILLAQKDDHKSLENYVFQYNNAPLYVDRREAIAVFSQDQDTSELARQNLLKSLNDKYHGLRELAIQSLDMDNDKVKSAALPLLEQIVNNDPKTTTRAAALQVLAKLNDPAYKALFQSALSNPSYSVEAAALNGLNAIDTAAAYTSALNMEKGAVSPLTSVIAKVYAQHGQESDLAYIEKQFDEAGMYEKFAYVRAYVQILGSINDQQKVDEAVDKLKKLAEDIHSTYGKQVLTRQLSQLQYEKEKAAKNATEGAAKGSLKNQANYIKKAISALNGGEEDNNS